MTETMGAFDLTRKKQKKQRLPKQESIPGIEVGKPLPIAGDYPARMLCMDFWSASYDGGPWYKKSRDADGMDVLARVPGEANDALDLRRQLATYKNYCKPIVNRYIGLVYGSGKVVREQENARYKAFLDDCDGLGSTLHDFMTHAQRQACVEGVRYCIMESDRRSDVASVLDATLSDANMFLVDVDPRQVLNYCHVGNKLVQCLVSRGDRNARYYDQYIYFDVFLDEGNKVESIGEPATHGYPDIPVVQVFAFDSGDSMLQDIAELNKAIFNLDSLHRTELQRQTFTTHFILGAEKSDIETLVSGGRRFVTIPRTGDISIETVGADISQADSLRQAMGMDIGEIWRLAGLSNPEVVQNTESGRALRIRFDEISAQAKAIADAGEKAEASIAELWKDGMADANVADAQYPDSFSQEDVSVDVDIFGKLPNEPAKLKKMLISKIASELFPGMDEADSVELALEIEGMEFEDPAEEMAGGKKPEKPEVE